MDAVDRQRLLAALALLVAALFVAAGMPPAGRWRLRLRRAAILAFALAAALAIGEIAWWLAGFGG